MKIQFISTTLAIATAAEFHQTPNVLAAPLADTGVRHLSRSRRGVCKNTDMHDGVDAGCKADAPFCMLENGRQPPPQGDGYSCGVCVNTVKGHIFPDMGCSTSAKLCDAPPGLVGMSCEASINITCFNNATEGEVDDGCSEEAPICINSVAGTEGRLQEPGDQCVACLNSFTTKHNEEGLNDFGCGLNDAEEEGEEAPRCMTENATDPFVLQAGTQCCAADGNCTHDCTVEVGSGLCTDSDEFIFDACGYFTGDCTSYAEADENAIGWIYLTDTYCVVLYMDSYVDGKSAEEVCDPDYISYFTAYSGEGEIEDTNGASSFFCYACE